MRLADAMLELTCPAQTEVARSFTSDARAAAPSVSAVSSKKQSRAARGPTASSSTQPRQNRSSSSGIRTGASPQTVSVTAALRRQASRRLGSAAPAPVGSSSMSILQSTIGSSDCGLSNSSTEGSSRSCGVTTPQRCRHGSPRWERFFMSTRSCSLACRPSAMLLLGVAKGSAIRLPSRHSCESSAQLSKSLAGAKPAFWPADVRADAMASAISTPVRTGDMPKTNVPRRTTTPRTTPVSAGGNEPSEAARAARCLTWSNTRARWCRDSKRICPVSSAWRCVAPSMMPGSRAVELSRGVVLRTARLQMQTVWLAVPCSGWHCGGARRQACRVVLLASLALRTRPT